MPTQTLCYSFKLRVKNRKLDATRYIVGTYGWMLPMGRTCEIGILWHRFTGCQLSLLRIKGIKLLGGIKNKKLIKSRIKHH